MALGWHGRSSRTAATRLRGRLMVVRNRYVDGEPCWADVVAPDMSTAQRFYGAVFGWTFADAPHTSGDDVLCLQENQPVGALRAPTSDTALPAAWTTYLSTSDSAATGEDVERAGGRVLRATEHRD